MIKAFTEENDEVIIQTPVYYPFYDVIEKSNRRVVKNPLRFDGEQYTMDFQGLEAIITEKKRKYYCCVTRIILVVVSGQKMSCVSLRRFVRSTICM